MRNNDTDWEEDRLNSGSENKNLVRFLARLISNWYWFILCIVLGLSVAHLNIRYSIPSYNINAKILIADNGASNGMAAAFGELPGISSTNYSVENEVEILQTGDLMRQVVLVDKAYISFFFEGNIQRSPILETPFKVDLLNDPDSILKSQEFKIKALKGNNLELTNADTLIRVLSGRPFYLVGVGKVMFTKLQESYVDDGNYGVRFSTVKQAIAHKSGAISVGVTNKNVSTISLTLVDQLPKRGESFLNSFIVKYMERDLNDKNIVADSTLSFISSRLSKITEELAGVEDKLTGYKRNNQLFDLSEQGKTFLQNSTIYTNSLAEIETKLAAIDDVAAYLSDTNNPRVVPSMTLFEDVAFAGLVNSYNSLVLQRERLLMGNTLENPLVKNINAQLASVREDMISYLDNARQQIELARSKQQQLSNRVTSQIQQVPTIERGFIDLSRLQQIKQAQYIFLQEKWEETAITRTANVPNAKIIDSPKAEALPFSPKTNIVYLAGLLAGLFLPLLVIVLKDMLNVRIRGIEDIDRHNRQPILGMISHSSDSEQVVVTKTSRSPIAEQFRAIRTNLEFALKGGKTILFTSSMSGEGKSYIALNLAVTLALLDKKVIIMELDLRKPSITTKLGLSSNKGFSHYIVRPDMSIEDIIMSSGTHENVHLIQAGAIPPNPAELLIHPRAKQLMVELAERYDYILMDAPPVGIVTDAQLLSRYSDLCLYIVRQNHTFKEQLRIPNDLVAQEKIRPIQIIVNDIKSKGGYYGSYGYGYGYGYGDYGQESTKSKRWTFWKK